MVKGKSDSNTIQNTPAKFLINTSNQANLTDVNDISAYQINSVFIFVDPYRLENFKIEEAPELEVDMDKKGHVWINNQEYELIEIKPGISIFGIVKHKKE